MLSPEGIMRVSTTLSFLVLASAHALALMAPAEPPPSPPRARSPLLESVTRAFKNRTVPVVVVDVDALGGGFPAATAADASVEDTLRRLAQRFSWAPGRLVPRAQPAPGQNLPSLVP